MFSHVTLGIYDFAKAEPLYDAIMAALTHDRSDEGLPGLRPHYQPNYSGAYVRDPEGNKLQAVCHGANG